LCTDLEGARPWGGPFNGPKHDDPAGSDADTVGRRLVAILRPNERSRPMRMCRVECARCDVDVVSFGYSGWLTLFETAGRIVLVDCGNQEEGAELRPSEAGAECLVPCDPRLERFVRSAPRASEAAGRIALPSGWLLVLSIGQDLTSVTPRLSRRRILASSAPAIQHRTDDGGLACIVRTPAAAYRVFLDAERSLAWQRAVLVPM
jgi:hypothetical protein